jgi:hypothetical protein
VRIRHKSHDLHPSFTDCKVLVEDRALWRSICQVSSIQTRQYKSKTLRWSSKSFLAGWQCRDADHLPRDSSVAFAPELFQAAAGDATIAPEQLASLAANASSTLDTLSMPASPPHVAAYPTIQAADAEMSNSGTSAYPLDGLENLTTNHDAMEVDSKSPEEPHSHIKKPGKPRKRRDSEQEPRSSIHSSKNEGQHTDKRYLCYMCNKLFTRRRSVRDHLAKIHNVKSWEPQRSLEVTVDPKTGEPTESIEDVIARGPPPAPEKPPKVKKEKTPKDGIRPSEEPALAPSTAQEIAAGGEFDLGEFPDVGVKESTPEQSLPPLKQDKMLDKEPRATPKAVSPAPEQTTSIATTSVAGKKRPAPDANKPLPASVTKKGTAKPRPTKKPRLTESDSISDRSTPFRSPSATPVTATRAPMSKLKRQISAATSPASSRAASEAASPSPSAADTPGSSNDDGEVFCICRRGDNHTWMIACDGECEEWYHGKCVNIRERDGDLIDKYICPRCTQPDRITTWKRMCRRQDCRKPARVFDDPPSKYCSKECGRMFFVELLRRGDPKIDTVKNDQYVVNHKKPRKLRKKRTNMENKVKISPRKPLAAVNGEAVENSDSRLATPAYSEDEKSEYETDSSADEDELPNRGGPLRAGEVRAIADSIRTIDGWRQLGHKPSTPPPDISSIILESAFDDFETRKLRDIEQQKIENAFRLEMLDAREKLLNLIKVRSAGIGEEVKTRNTKWKDVCGFDPRVAWNEDMFILWYKEKGGKEILKSDKPRIGPPEDDSTTGSNVPNGVQDDSDAEREIKTKKGGVCIKNKCTRHRTWLKSAINEIRFEQDMVNRNVRKTEELEKGIRERAALRALQ